MIERRLTFRLVPYFAWQKVDLLEWTENFVDVTKKTLDDFWESDETEKTQLDIWFENIRHSLLDENKPHPENDQDLANEES